MTRMVLAAVAALLGAALLGSALTFGFGTLGTRPVQAAEGQRILAPAMAAPVSAGPAVDAPGAPYTQAIMENRLKLRFSATDANGDGVLSFVEARAAGVEARAARRALAFEAMDRDRNGSVSRAEFEAQADARRDLFRKSRNHRDRSRSDLGRSGRPGFIGTRQFDRLDSDRDGRVMLDEALASSLAWFQRSDSNGDGRLTAAERKAARQTVRGDRREWRKGRERAMREGRDLPT